MVLYRSLSREKNTMLASRWYRDFTLTCIKLQFTAATWPEALERRLMVFFIATD